MRELGAANEALSSELVSGGAIAHASMPGFESEHTTSQTSKQASMRCASEPLDSDWTRGTSNSALTRSFPLLLPSLSSFCLLYSASIHKSFTVCSQRVSKFKESADKANSVQIYLAVLRLRHVGTDLLISYNVPQHFAPGSSSEGRPILGSAENLAVIEGVLKSLQVKQWELFGSSA